MVEIPVGAGNLNIVCTNKLKQSSRFVYLMDSWHGTAKRQIWTIKADASSNIGVGAHHNNRANIGFMDGHVKGFDGNGLAQFGITGYYRQGVKIGG